MALGVDIAGVEDVSPFLELSTGPKAAGEAALSSLLHSPGVLWWAPDRGYNVRQHLNAAVTVERVQRNVRTQVEAGERVESAEVVAEVFAGELRIDVKLTLTEEDGDVEFTLTIDQLGAVLNASVVS